MGNSLHYDKQTKEFFDSHLPEYPTNWFRFLLSFVQKTSSSTSTLIDLACGAGNILAFFRKNTNIARCVGVDISTVLLEKARLDLGLEVYELSILDENLPGIVGSNYDYAMLGQVLHHLVGSTRNQSKANAGKAVLNAFRLLRPGGYLLIHEPTLYPSISGDLIFWVKRLTTKVFPKRINLFKKFHNIGVPVVSYLTAKELKRMVQDIPNFRIVDWVAEVYSVSWVMRLGLIGACVRISCVAQKLSNGDARR